MAEGKKAQYEIVINGLKETIDLVESLNKQLDGMKSRLDELKSSNVNINASSTSSSVDTAPLKEKDDLLKKIEASQRKIADAESEEYQTLLKNKDIFKEIDKVRKASVSELRLSVGDYANTLDGMRQKLTDMKRVIANTDLDDSGLKQMIEDANTLNDEIKKVEEAYGTFGRNVGNYKSAAEGFKELTITVNGVERSFSSAKQAYKELKNERDTMALNGEKETEQFKELDKTVKTLSSDLNDLSKSSSSMDNLLDTMESFIAVANVSKGLSALFGFDDSKIEESIQKLVALQNVLKGLESIQKQMQTRRRLG